MKTRIFTLIMSLFIATMAFAYDAQIDGIYYNFDQENKTAMVTNAGNVGGSDGNSAGYTQSEIIIPEKVSYNGAVYTIASIGYLAFYDCSYLTSITIPNSVTEVGGGVFYGCENLRSVVLSENVTSLPMGIVSENYGGAYDYYYYYGFFGRCSSLTSITIPNSVTSIGDLAFSGCSSLTSIIIPNSVTEVGGGVFCACENLKSVVLSENMISLPDYYEYKEWNGSFYNLGFFERCSSLTSITIPNSVTSIGNYAFAGCSSLTSVQWNVKKCSDFSYDSRPFDGCEQITSFTFGDNVEHIPAFLCRGMTGLTSISISNSVTSIGEYAFADCSSLTSITIPNSVTEFGDFILADCNNIQILNAPVQIFNHVTEVYQTQFSNKLTEVHITDGELDENGFNYINRSKKSLHTIDLAGTTNTVINDLAFYDCYKLENLMLPGNLETIGFKAVAECYQLKEINIPASVVEINDAAFENCRSIKSITFGGQAEAKSFASRMKRAAADGDVALQRIGNWAFYNCHALENLVIPEGVTEVGDAAFYGCTYLDSLALPSTTQRIGDNCFALCSRMKQINVNATVPPTIFAKTFFDVNRNIPVIVPEGARDAYANDEYWGEFINVVESGEDTSIENAENANVAIYSVGGMLYVDGLSADYQVFDVNGRLVYSGRESALSLPRGVYVVAIGGEVEKVVI